MFRLLPEPEGTEQAPEKAVSEPWDIYGSLR